MQIGVGYEDRKAVGQEDGQALRILVLFLWLGTSDDYEKVNTKKIKQILGLSCSA